MKLLTSKAGVTVLEGVIALGLLAVVTAGAFGVLLSASRKSAQPDMREEMLLAVEKAKDKLQLYIDTQLSENSAAHAHLPANVDAGLCDDDAYAALQTGVEHDITSCMLPAICDKDSENSKFSYMVGPASGASSRSSSKNSVEGSSDRPATLCENCAGYTPRTLIPLTITFTIKCNGYEL